MLNYEHFNPSIHSIHSTGFMTHVVYIVTLLYTHTLLYSEIVEMCNSSRLQSTTEANTSRLISH